MPGRHWSTRLATCGRTFKQPVIHMGPQLNRACFTVAPDGNRVLLIGMMGDRFQRVRQESRGKIGPQARSSGVWFCITPPCRITLSAKLADVQFLAETAVHCVHRKCDNVAQYQFSAGALVYVIHHQDLGGEFSRFQSEPELFLQSGEDGGRAVTKEPRTCSQRPWARCDRVSPPSE